MRVVVRKCTKRGEEHCMDIKFHKHNQEHNSVGPSHLRLNNDKFLFQKYRIHDLLHRENGPAVIDWYNNGVIALVGWYVNNQLSRNDGPALSQWYSDGTIKSERHCVNNQLHAVGKPALVEYNFYGTVKRLEYRQHDKLHNDHGYAYKYITDDYTLYTWYTNGRLHNGLEPAWIREGKDGTIDRKWYFNGFQWGLFRHDYDTKPHWIPNYFCSRDVLDSIADWISNQDGDWFNPTPEMMALFKLTWCR